MSNNNNKPSIPAWQRAQPPAVPPEDHALDSQPPPPSPTPESNSIETGESESEREREQVTAAESEGKDAAPDPEAVSSIKPSPTPAAAFDTSDFAQYQQQSQQSQYQRQSQHQQQQSQRIIAPPIITYPEFLVDAHKPPPLITPARLINTLYFAGGLSALLYGASKWLITPMIDSLSESRHDLHLHSHSKLEEFNTRLEKVVSTIPPSSSPDSKKKDAVEEEDHDAESITSDPTELYHRDMGTQTSDLPPSKPQQSPPPSSTPLDHQTSVLHILTSHFSELCESSENIGNAHTERLLTFNKFRHFLDGMLYNTDGLPTWEAGIDGAMTMKQQGVVKQDGIEELKKEIRGVKGVLLSARRFPKVGAR